MSFIVKKLTLEMLKEKWESFIESLTWLKWNKNADLNKMIKIFEKNKSYETVFVVIEEETWKIVGNMRALCDHKYIRWGCIWWRVEEVSIPESYQWKWIWKMLMKASLEFFKEQWCYKVTLACEEQNIWFYSKFWFEAMELEMKMYV